MRLRLGLGILAITSAIGWAQTPAPPAPPAPPARSNRLLMMNTIGSYLGIGVVEVTPDRAKTLNMKEDRGAEVSSVAADSPAAKAGLKVGDVVLEYNGQPVQGTEQLTRMVRETPPERQVKMTVWRNGRTETVTATIGTRSGNSGMIMGAPDGWVMPEITIPRISPPQIDIPRFQMNWQNPRLGITGEALGQEEQLAEFFGVKEGVLVKSVVKNSAAEKAGIKAGDVITKVGDSKVNSTEEITRVLRGLRDAKNTLSVTVVRAKKEMPVTVTIEGSGSGAIRAFARNVRV